MQKRLDELNKIVIDRNRWNKSVYFILPMIGISSNYFGLVNCYLGDNTTDEQLDYKQIFVRIASKDDKLQGLKHYNKCYELPDRSFMYVFNIPNEYSDDYYLFCEGKYSKFSNLYKEQIIRLLSTRPFQDSSVYKILYKTLDQREKIEFMIGEKLLDHEEVCSKPNMEFELYNHDKCEDGSEDDDGNK